MAVSIVHMLANGKRRARNTLSSKALTDLKLRNKPPVSARRRSAFSRLRQLQVRDCFAGAGEVEAECGHSKPKGPDSGKKSLRFADHTFMDDIEFVPRRTGALQPVATRGSAVGFLTHSWKQGRRNRFGERGHSVPGLHVTISQNCAI